MDIAAETPSASVNPHKAERLESILAGRENFESKGACGVEEVRILENKRKKNFQMFK